jgi:hypothetical protein
MWILLITLTFANMNPNDAPTFLTVSLPMHSQADCTTERDEYWRADGLDGVGAYDPDTLVRHTGDEWFVLHAVCLPAPLIS